MKSKLVPDFFIPGFPKCGTTSLHELLSKSEFLTMSKVKEPHFYSPDIQWYRKKRVDSLERYLENFEGDVSTLWGESSTWYLYSETAVDRIEACNSNAKYIVCIRKPSSAVKSLIYHRIYSGKEKGLSYESVINSANSRAFYFSVYDYEQIVGRLLSKVDRKRIHFLVFEDFICAKNEAFRDIFNFLGVPILSRNNVPNKNSSKTNRPVLAQRLMRLVPVPVKSILLKMLGDKVRSSFWNIMAFVVPTRAGAKDAISSEALAALNAADEAALKYFTLLEVDVSSWKVRSCS